MKMTNDIPDAHNPDSYSLTHNTDTDKAGSFLQPLWASIAATAILTVICCGVYPLVVWAVAQAAFPAKANGSLVKKDGTPTSDEKLAVGSSLLGQTFALPGYFHPRPSAANNSAGSGFSSSSGYDPTSSGGTNFGPLSDELINGLVNTPATATAPATQPVAHLDFDGIRLRTVHYALDNNIAFKLHHAIYVKQDDGSYKLVPQDQVPLKTFQDAQGNLLEIPLVTAFPHPTSSDEYSRTVVIADEFATPIPADAVTASGSGLDPHITPDNAEIQKARIATARNIKPEQVEELIVAHTDNPDLGILGDPGVNVLMLNLALDAKYPLPAPAGK